MLDAVVDYLPSPLDIPPMEGHDVDEPEKVLIRQCVGCRAVRRAGFQDHDRSFCRSVGVLPGVFGQAECGRQHLSTVGKGRKERIGRLLRMHANKREEIQDIIAGDICAAVGLKNVTTGDTICDEKAPITLEPIDFPIPVIQLAVEPKTKADQEKMGMAIQKLAQEDPTFRVATDPETGQTILVRHGRAAPGNHCRSHDARVWRGGECRQAASGVSRNHPQECASGRPPGEADRW